MCSVTKYDDKLEIDLACDGSSNLGDGWGQRLISWRSLDILDWYFERNASHITAERKSIYPSSNEKMKKSAFIETSLIKRLLS